MHDIAQQEQQITNVNKCAHGSFGDLHFGINLQNSGFRIEKPKRLAKTGCCDSDKQLYDHNRPSTTVKIKHDMNDKHNKHNQSSLNNMHLMRRAHEDVVGDFAERQPQVDDIILRAAAFREVADVNDSARRGLSGGKRLQTKKKKNPKNISVDIKMI